MQQNEVHISSLVVHTRAHQLQEVKLAIDALSGAEVYGENASGKLVVVLETSQQGYITDTIDKINGLENVLNTALVFHQIEEFDSQSKDES